MRKLDAQGRQIKLSKQDRDVLRCLDRDHAAALKYYREAILSVDPRPLSLQQIVQSALEAFWIERETFAEQEAFEIATRRPDNLQAFLKRTAQ